MYYSNKPNIKYQSSNQENVYQSSSDVIAVVGMCTCNGGNCRGTCRGGLTSGQLR